MAVTLCAVSAVACIDPGDGAGAAALAPLPSEGRLRAMAASERAALFARLAEAARAEHGSDRGVRHARDAARVAAIGARSKSGATQLPAARDLLRSAMRSGATAAERCEAGLELARLDAVLADDAAAARSTLAELRERFADADSARACLGRARRLAKSLPAEAEAEASPMPPPPTTPLATQELAAGSLGPDADPDADPHADPHAWLAAEAKAGTAARPHLQRIAVYGAAAAAGAPPGGRDVRAVLHFDAAAVYRRGEIAAAGLLPRRVTLDLDDVGIAPEVAHTFPVAAGGLSRIRIVALGASRTRVSFDVTPSASYRVFYLADPFRVVVDFSDPQAAVQQKRAAGRLTTIVLDPGHGGEQPGAQGPDGLKESHVALALARRTRRVLLRQLADVDVILTRSDDRFISLEERTAIANGYDADLFVSIHLNASESSEDKGGVSTFVLDTTDDQAALRLAALENGTDVAGVSRLQLILASLYRHEQAEQSLALARMVQSHTLAGGRRILPQLGDRGVKRALFYVLVGARMPAVLLEASFISRPDEAAALRSDGYRDALAEGIARGIARYVEHSRRAR